jgi:hypothetical protein
MVVSDPKAKDGWRHLRGAREVVMGGQRGPKHGTNHGMVPWVGANLRASRRGGG